MSKSNFSVQEKKLIRSVVIVILVQLLVILFFIYALNQSKPISLQNTKQIDITVENVNYFRTVSEFRLSVYSNSTEYVFTGRPTLKEYSVNKLSKTISTSDKLSIIYYQTHGVFGEKNLIVEAKDKNKTYRSLSEYNKGKNKLLLFVIIIFAIFEFIFFTVYIFYIRINISVLKKLISKFKR